MKFGKATCPISGIGFSDSILILLVSVLVIVYQML